jgi:hypothetical protein
MVPTSARRSAELDSAPRWAEPAADADARADAAGDGAGAARSEVARTASAAFPLAGLLLVVSPRGGGAVVGRAGGAVAVAEDAAVLGLRQRAESGATPAARASGLPLFSLPPSPGPESTCVEPRRVAGAGAGASAAGAGVRGSAAGSGCERGGGCAGHSCS